ncbi:MAG: TIGR03790 family protein [Planctomycetota bacterium]
MIRKTSLCIAAVISFVQLPCFAGGGPENVFLLVNSTSANSMEVANHYVDLRQIPESNVFYLPYLGSKSVVNGDTFRGQILLPALIEIDKRELTGRIDYLVYSCDFPWRINLTSDYPGKKFPPQLSPRGGLTGLTYLAAFVKQKREEVVGLNTNLYFIEPTRGVTISRAFKSKYRWAVGGRRTAAQGLSYIISSMLGVTDDRGNKVSEIVNCLKLARSADGTSPSGTVYYMKHGGPRSKPRHEFFAGAASELRTLGVEAKILPGKFPENKSSIAGLTCGTARAELGRSGCRFLPGAFCDNLTSYGGTLSNYKPPIDKKTGKKSVYQVSVADFIRYGATSACGTVFEPYSIKQKFPVPSVHVHYVNGCSLGESFYQSVQGPYQQLLVGDPLCQPWAKIPTVEAKELGVRGMLRGTVRFTPTVDAEHDMPIDFFELFVDGERIGQCKPGGELQWDTTTTEDGYHEVRIVSVDDTPIATQGRLVKVIGVKNGLDAIGLSTDRRQIALTDEFVTVNVASTVESQVELFCNTRKVGSLASGSGRVRIPLNKLGAGPVEVYAIGAGQRSKSIGFEIAVR